MKTLVKILVVTSAMMILMIQYCFAQEYTRLERSKEIYFNVESEQTESIVSIDRENSILELRIRATLNEGTIYLEVQNPDGEKKGNFTVKSSESHNIKKGKNTEIKEKVSGELSKIFRNPPSGDWIIVIKPEKAIGMVQIQTTTIFHPKADLMEVDQIKDETE